MNSSETGYEGDVRRDYEASEANEDDDIPTNDEDDDDDNEGADGHENEDEDEHEDADLDFLTDEDEEYVCLAVISVPSVIFLGYNTGEDEAILYRSADGAYVTWNPLGHSEQLPADEDLFDEEPSIEILEGNDIPEWMRRAPNNQDSPYFLDDSSEDDN
ncbi:hypothetical protein IAU59_007597 [Kwoniella sp. CBS 9459]